MQSVLAHTDKGAPCTCAYSQRSPKKFKVVHSNTQTHTHTQTKTHAQTHTHTCTHTHVHIQAAAARAEVGLAPDASDAELAQAQKRKVLREPPPPHM